MSAPPELNTAQWQEALRWFDHADDDLRTAEVCAAADPPLLGPGAYHCQQAAEKILKGLLVANGERFPKTHDLKDLANRVAPHYPDWGDAMMALRELTVWGLAYRYPAEEEAAADPPAIDRIRAVMAQVRALSNAARAFPPAPPRRSSEKE